MMKKEQRQDGSDGLHCIGQKTNGEKNEEIKRKKGNKRR